MRIIAHQIIFVSHNHFASEHSSISCGQPMKAGKKKPKLLRCVAKFLKNTHARWKANIAAGLGWEEKYDEDMLMKGYCVGHGLAAKDYT